MKVISVPATGIATEHEAIQAANTAMFGALMQTGKLGYLRRLTKTPSGLHSPRSSGLIPKKLEILKVGAAAVRVLEMAARK